MPRYSREEFHAVGGLLGGGAYGQVSKVVHKSTGDVFAIKSISKQKLVEHGMTENLEREVKTQLRLKHPNILRLHYYFEDDESVQLLLEFASGGSIFGLLKKQGRLPEPEAAKYFVEVASGLQHLHAKGVIHRDIKPENILLCHKGVAKLADFGWCAEVAQKDGDSRKTFCGTWDYISPEMVQNEPHDCMVDVWAAGVLLYEMLTCKAPFHASSQMKALIRISEVDLQFPDFFPDLAQDLVRKILVKEPTQRLSLAAAIEHQWVSAFVVPTQSADIRLPVDRVSSNASACPPGPSLLPTSALTPTPESMISAAELTERLQDPDMATNPYGPSNMPARPNGTALPPASQIPTSEYLGASSSSSTRMPEEPALEHFGVPRRLLGNPSTADSLDTTRDTLKSLTGRMHVEGPTDFDGTQSLAHVDFVDCFKATLPAIDASEARGSLSPGRPRGISLPCDKEDVETRLAHTQPEPRRHASVSEPLDHASTSEPVQRAGASGDSALPTRTAELLKALNSSSACAALRSAKVRSCKNALHKSEKRGSQMKIAEEYISPLNEVDTTSSSTSVCSRGSIAPGRSQTSVDGLFSSSYNEVFRNLDPSTPSAAAASDVLGSGCEGRAFTQ